MPRALGEARFRELPPAGPAPSAARAEGVPFPTRIPGAAEVERGATSTGASDANAAQGGHTDAAAGAITDTRAAALEPPPPPLPPSAPRNRAPGGARNCNDANATAASGPIAAPHAGRPSNDDAAQVVRVPLPEKQAASGSKTKKLVPGSKKIVSSQIDPFENEGYCLGILFSEAFLEDDDMALPYAMYCWHRHQFKLKRKKNEVCDICFFQYGKVIAVLKDEMEKHCNKEHTEKIFDCKNKGCFVRCDSLGAAGLHRLYVHEKKPHDWWSLYLEKHRINLS